MILYSHVDIDLRGIKEIRLYYWIPSEVARQKMSAGKKDADNLSKLCLVSGRSLPKEIFKQKTQARTTSSKVKVFLIIVPKYGTIRVSGGVI
jgi:hypothetical protein